MNTHSSQINLNGLQKIDDGYKITSLSNLQQVLTYIHHHGQYVKVYDYNHDFIRQDGIIIKDDGLRYNNVTIEPVNSSKDGWFYIWDISFAKELY